MANRSTTAYAATILRPRMEVYEFWRNWSNLPRFSRHLKSVEDLGNGRTRWTTIGPTGDVSWEAETTRDIPGDSIAWRASQEADVWNAGEVRFKDAPGDRGTEVTLRMAYDIPFGIVGEAVAKVTGTAPEAEIAESIRRFKAILECGEVPSVEGQPSNQMRDENVPGDASPKVGLR